MLIEAYNFILVPTYYYYDDDVKFLFEFIRGAKKHISTQQNKFTFIIK